MNAQKNKFHEVQEFHLLYITMDIEKLCYFHTRCPIGNATFKTIQSMLTISKFDLYLQQIKICDKISYVKHYK